MLMIDRVLDLTRDKHYKGGKLYDVNGETVRQHFDYC